MAPSPDRELASFLLGTPGFSMRCAMALVLCETHVQTASEKGSGEPGKNHQGFRGSPRDLLRAGAELASPPNRLALSLPTDLVAGSLSSLSGCSDSSTPLPRLPKGVSGPPPEGVTGGG